MDQYNRKYHNDEVPTKVIQNMNRLEIDSFERTISHFKIFHRNICTALKSI